MNPYVAQKLMQFCNQTYITSNTYCANNRGLEFSIYDSDIGKVLAIKGSVEIVDWMADVNIRLVKVSGGRVHEGFLALIRELTGVLENNSIGISDPLWVTGHSLGGALASLIAPEVQDRFGLHGVYTFGSPCVGDEDIAGFIERKIQTPIYRVVNRADVVPRLPFLKSTNPLAGIYDHLPWNYLEGIARVIKRFERVS
jgi:triacylglycerol lipase